MRPWHFLLAAALVLGAVFGLTLPFVGAAPVSETTKSHNSGDIVRVVKHDSGGYPVDCFVVYGDTYVWGTQPAGISCLYGQGPKE